MAFRTLLAFLALWFAALAPASSAGTWQSGQIPIAGINGGQFKFNYLLPPGYSSTETKIPLLIHEHTHNQGTPCYQGSGCTYLPTGCESDCNQNANNWYNNDTFMVPYRSIIVLPYADQTSDTSGQTSNFGGYGDTPGKDPNEKGVAALAKYFIQNFRVDANRIYITGDSLGGHGSIAACLDYGAANGTVDRIFAACLSYSGQIQRGGVTSAIINQVKTGPPLWTVSGTNDGTSPPDAFNRPIWQGITGNTSYPNAPGAQAGSSPYRYGQIVGGGHSTVWETYRTLPNAKPMYDWMFAQNAGLVTGGGGGTGLFSVGNGLITGPDGKNWIGKGINVYDSAMGQASTGANGQPLTRLLPGINFIRLPVYSYRPVSDFTTFIKQMTDLKIVVLIEHHQGAGGGVAPLTGQALTDENNWFGTIAAAFKANPYVWYGSLNEPGGPGNLLTANQVGTYNAVRNAGNNNIVVLQTLGDYPDGVHLTVGSGHGLTPNSAYATMKNVVFDFHFYNGLPHFNANDGSGSYSTDTNFLKNLLATYIAQSKTIPTADGTPAVVIGEYGPSTDGNNRDPGGMQTVDAVLATNISSTAWNWASGAGDDNITDGNNNLTAYGQKVAAGIAANATQVGESLSVNKPTNVRTATTFTVSGTISGVTAAPPLQYQDNSGAWTSLPAGSTITSSAFSFTHPAIANGNTNFVVSVRDTNNISITASSPAFIVAAPASPSNTVITTVGPFIVNSIGETFGITSGGQVLVNGAADTTTANVVQLAYVNGIVWQQNTAGDWYSKAVSTDNWAGPTTTSPIAGLPETISINTIAGQRAGVEFTVSGVIGNATSAPTLQYADNNGNWQPLPSVSGVTRNYYEHPGGQGSAYNTPIGAGATWGAVGDADTIDISRGWNGSSYTAGPVGVINPVSNFGATYYVGKSTDGTYTFSSNLNGRNQGIDSGSSISATLHVPTGAIGPGPYQNADNPLILADPVTFPCRQYTFGGVPIEPPGLQPGQGPFTGAQGEWDDACSDQYGEDADTGMDGYNIGAGLITYCDVTPSCNPDYPKIKHAFRYSTDAALLKDNAVTTGQQFLKPDSWPQRLQDGQSGLNLYHGNLKAGTTLGIPLSTAQPAGLNANCAGMFWSMQHYPSFFRDQAGGGFHYTADQVADTSSYIADVRGCLAQLVKLLRPMRNQHQTGQDFTAFPKNGPGARSDTGPRPLAGAAGGTVTATSFSFTHPGMAAGASNTISIRDANQTTVSAASNAFAVATAAVETITVNSIPNQITGASFTVSGAIGGLTTVPTLQYQDGTTGWKALPVGAVVSSGAFSFTHPGMSSTSGITVQVRDAVTQTAVGASNTFSVTATASEQITVNTVPDQASLVAFTLTGSVANIPSATTVLTLQYADNGGGWASFPAGSTISSISNQAATFSLVHPGMPSNASNTIAIRDAANTSISASSNAFRIAPAESANNSVVTTVGPAIVDAIGESFTITSGGLIAVDGVPDNTTANVIALAYVNHVVWQKNQAGNWYSKANAAATWQGPTTTSPLPAVTLAVSAIADQRLNTAFTVNGTISSALVAPSLQYSIAGGAWASLPTGSTVTTSAFSFVVPGIGTAGASYVSVRDAGTPSISAQSASFNVAAAAVHVLTVQTIGNQTANVAFNVTGTIANAATAPALEYAISGGGFSALPGGAIVTASSYSFTVPGIVTLGSASITVRESAAPGISASSNTFQISAAAVETLAINTIGNQAQSTAFTVTGVITNATSAPRLEYAINGGAWASLPTGAIVSTGSFSFTAPGIASAGPSTVAVRDAAAPGITATSNTFQVGTVLTKTLSINPIGNQPQSTVFVVTGTITNAVSAPTLEYSVSGGAFVALPGGATVSNQAFSFTVPGIAAVGAATIRVRDAGTPSIQAVSNSFQVTAPVVQTLAIAQVSNHPALQSFAVTGTIANSTGIPTLEYRVSAGGYLPLPAGSAVSATAFSFIVPGIATSGTATIGIRNALNTSVSATSNTFQVTAPGVESLTVAPIATQPAGIAFAVAGTISNVASAPSLQYSDNGGAYQNLPPGSSVTATAFSFVHPGLPASQSMTVSVRDSQNQSVVSSAPVFQVIARESPNLAVVTTVGPQIIDSAGNAYTLTPGHQVAVNGVPDTTTSNVIEIAYVNRTVWYENSALHWWSRNSAVTWTPTGGTVLGPLPSSRATIYQTNTQRLAVVQNFTVAVPGIVINDTVTAGTFNVTVKSAFGTMTMPGAVGTGTGSLATSGSLAQVNAALAGLNFTGKIIGQGGIAIQVVDPASVTANLMIPMSVVRAPGVIQGGRSSPRRRRSGRQPGRRRKSVGQRKPPIRIASEGN